VVNTPFTPCTRGWGACKLHALGKRS
jgi:hypothetical protein